MDGRIGRLQIVKKKVRVCKDFLKTAPWNIPGCIHCRMDMMLSTGLQYIGKKIHLRHAFTAGKGHPSAGVFIVRQICQDGFHEVRCRNGCPHCHQGLRKAVLRTQEASVAKVSVYEMDTCRIQLMGSLRANLKTPAAADASFPMKHNLIPEGNRLGIMTPKAFQVAAFEKYGCADSRTIVSGKTLDVENSSRHHIPPSQAPLQASGLQNPSSPRTRKTYRFETTSSPTDTSSSTENHCV